MAKQQKLAGLRLGLTYGAGLVLIGLVVAMIALPRPVAAAPLSICSQALLFSVANSR